jgi:hypothetical protein
MGDMRNSSHIQLLWPSLKNEQIDNLKVNEAI